MTQNGPSEQPAPSTTATGGAPAQGGDTPPSANVNDIPTVPEQDTPITRKRENVRGKLGYGLIALFALELAAAFVCAVIGGELWVRMQEFLQITFAGLVGLVGAVVGFYFGSQR